MGQFIKFKWGWNLSEVLQIVQKMHTVSCTDTHHGITDLLNHEVAKNIKTWISWERNVIFLWNEKNLNLCLRWHILRNYHLVKDATFKETRNISSFTALLKSFPLMALVQQIVKISKLVEIDKANFFTWKRHFNGVFIL